MQGSLPLTYLRPHLLYKELGFFTYLKSTRDRIPSWFHFPLTQSWVALRLALHLQPCWVVPRTGYTRTDSGRSCLHTSWLLVRRCLAGTSRQSESCRWSEHRANLDQAPKDLSRTCLSKMCNAHGTAERCKLCFHQEYPWEDQRTSKDWLCKLSPHSIAAFLRETHMLLV